MISPSPASRDLVEHISAHSGRFPSTRRLAPYFSYSAMLPGVSGPPPPAQRVHLSILPREPKLPMRGYCGAPKGRPEKQYPQPMHRSFEWSTTPSSVEKMHVTGQTDAQG